MANCCYTRRIRFRIISLYDANRFQLTLTAGFALSLESSLPVFVHTPPPESPIGERSVVMTVTLRRCHVSLCKHISRTTRVRSSPIFCLLHTAVARSRSGGVAIRYVLPVLRMTSYLYITARNKRRNSDSIGHEFVTVSYTLTDPPGAALDRVRSLNLRLLCFPNGSFTPDVLRCAALHCGAAWHLSDVNEP